MHLGNGSSPAALVCDQLDDLAKTRGIDWISVLGLAIVPEVLHGIELDDPWIADQLEQHVLWIAFGGVSDLGHHGLNREGARDVRHRAEPANAGMRGCLRILALDIGDLEGHVDQPHTEFERCLVHRIGGECRGDAWCYAAMSPGRNLAALVEAGLDTFHRDGVQETVADVVFPRPLHLDWRAEFLRKQCRFEGVVAFRLATEATAEEGDIDSDIPLGNTERLGDVFARST